MFIQSKAEAEKPLPFIIWGIFIALLITLLAHNELNVPWASILFLLLSMFVITTKLFSRIKHKLSLFNNLLKNI